MILVSRSSERSVATPATATIAASLLAVSRGAVPTFRRSISAARRSLSLARLMMGSGPSGALLAVPLAWATPLAGCVSPAGVLQGVKRFDMNGLAHWCVTGERWVQETASCRAGQDSRQRQQLGLDLARMGSEPQGQRYTWHSKLYRQVCRRRDAGSAYFVRRDRGAHQAVCSKLRHARQEHALPMKSK